MKYLNSFTIVTVCIYIGCIKHNQNKAASRLKPQYVNLAIDSIKLLHWKKTGVNAGYCSWWQPWGHWARDSQTASVVRHQLHGQTVCKCIVHVVSCAMPPPQHENNWSQCVVVLILWCICHPDAAISAGQKQILRVWVRSIQYAVEKRRLMQTQHETHALQGVMYLKSSKRHFHGCCQRSDSWSS